MKKIRYLSVGIVLACFLVACQEVTPQPTNQPTQVASATTFITFPTHTLTKTISPKGTSTKPTPLTSTSTNIIFPTNTPSPTSISIPTSTPTTVKIKINIPTTQYPTIPPSAPSYTVPINSIPPSEVTGTITFEDVAGAVAILLHIDGLEEEALVPVELLYGTCADPGSLAYSLASPDAGESETDLTINLSQFNTQKPMAVFLYQSSEDHTAIACGDIP